MVVRWVLYYCTYLEPAQCHHRHPSIYYPQMLLGKGVQQTQKRSWKEHSTKEDSLGQPLM